MEKVDAAELLSNLRQFTGTENYTRYTQRVILTDGALYLAENAACFWLMDLYASYLHYIRGEEFTCLKLTKTNDSADVRIEDGNECVLAEQHVPFTDFALNTITLFGCWAGEYWVVMLTSEY